MSQTLNPAIVASLHKPLLPYYRRWKPQPRPKGMRKMKAKACFANAGRLVTGTNPYNLTYCEGIAFTKSGFFFEHAWCIDENGYVVDPTTDDCVDYIGVPLTEYYICQCLGLNNAWWATLFRWDDVNQSIEFRKLKLPTIAVSLLAKGEIVAEIAEAIVPED